MAESWRQIWAENFDNAAIAAAASEFFGNQRATIEKRHRYGSANRLLISSRASVEVLVSLDGVTTFGILPARGSLSIEPRDGIFFDFVKLTNMDAAIAVADNELRVFIGRAEEN